MQYMTETYYRTGIHKVDHTTFGGIINPSDYSTEIGRKSNTKGSSIASRIISDKNFDKQCKRNLEIKIKKGEN